MYYNLKLSLAVFAVAFIAHCYGATGECSTALSSFTASDAKEMSCDGTMEFKVTGADTATVAAAPTYSEAASANYVFTVTGLSVQANTTCLTTGEQTCGTVTVYVGTASGGDGSPIEISGAGFDGLVVAECGTNHYIFPIEQDITSDVTISTDAADDFQTIMDTQETTVTVADIMLDELVNFDDVSKMYYYTDGTDKIVVFPENKINIAAADYTNLVVDGDTTTNDDTSLGATAAPTCDSVYYLKFGDDDSAINLKPHMIVAIAMPFFAMVFNLF